MTLEEYRESKNRPEDEDIYDYLDRTRKEWEDHQLFLVNHYMAEGELTSAIDSLIDLVTDLIRNK